MPNKWFAAALGLFSQPLAFIYLAKFKWALCYFFVLILFAIMDFFLAKKTGYSGLGLILAIVCCIHAFQTSKIINFDGNRRWYSKWWGVLLILIIFLSGIFSVRVFLYEPFYMPFKSMLPTLKVGDNIVVSKSGYGLYGTLGITVYSAGIDSRKKPKRGEVFVLYPPHGERVVVERIIGVPHDVIEFSDKQIYINGSKIDTKRAGNSNIYTETLDGNTYSVQYIRETDQYRNFKVEVPEDAYFVMGDNRDNSADSRAWGTVPAQNIVGKMVLIW